MTIKDVLAIQGSMSKRRHEEVYCPFFNDSRVTTRLLRACLVLICIGQLGTLHLLISSVCTALRWRAEARTSDVAFWAAYTLESWSLSVERSSKAPGAERHGHSADLAVFSRRIEAMEFPFVILVEDGRTVSVSPAKSVDLFRERRQLPHIATT